MFDPRAEIAASNAAPHWLAAMSSRSGGFAPDQRYSIGTPAAPPTADDDGEAEREMQRRLREAFAAGMAQGQAEARAEALAEREAFERLRMSLGRLDEKMSRQIADRLAETVALLCEVTLAPLALDRDALQRRCQAAASALGEAQESLTLHLHPDDIASLDPEFAQNWAIVAAPALERGTVRVEGAEAGAIDGPAEWRAALQAALSC